MCSSHAGPSTSIYGVLARLIIVTNVGGRTYYQSAISLYFLPPFRAERIEVFIDQVVCITICIMSQDYENDCHIEQSNIAIRVVEKELLCGGIEGAETREEDVHNGHWGRHWMHGRVYSSAKCVHCDQLTANKGYIETSRVHVVLLSKCNAVVGK